MQVGSLNRVLLVGHLGSDPESRYLPNGGDAVTTFNVATNERWKSQDNNLKEHTEWHRCVIFGKLAESAQKILKKGQLVSLEGKLRTRSWDDKAGVKRTTTEIICSSFTMLGKKLEGQSADVPNEPDEDLPF